MRILDRKVSTFGADRNSRLHILKSHVTSIFRRLTLKRLLNLIRAESARLTGRRTLKSMPYFLKIETTGFCNLQCRWCTGSRKQREAGQRPVTRLSIERFRALVDETGDYLFRINLYGFGEPLLHTETVDMIRYAADRNISVVVSSNMNLASFDASELIDSGLEQLIFSCHGASDRTVRKFMGEKADITLALANVRTLLIERSRRASRYPVVSWQYCVTGFNESEMEDARKLAAEAGMDEIRFIRPSFPPSAGDEWHSTLFPRRIVTVREGTAGCSWPWRGAYIACNSGVLPCCREELLLKSDAGSLEDRTFREIWNGDRYRDFRSIIVDPESFTPSEHIICSSCPELGFKPEIPVWDKENDEE